MQKHSAKTKVSVSELVLALRVLARRLLLFFLRTEYKESNSIQSNPIQSASLGIEFRRDVARGALKILNMFHRHRNDRVASPQWDAIAGRGFEYPSARPGKTITW